MARVLLVLIVLVSGVANAAESTEPLTFEQQPSAVKAGEKVKLSFAVSQKTDVEVAVLNAAGEVVRHLAAGVLGGENAPPAPLTTGMEQSLEWDGKDDFGQAVANASGCTFRVRAGMGVKLENSVGGDPYAFWSDQSGQGDHTQWRVTGLEVKSDGNVYVFGSTTPYGLPALRQYDARGNYRRTVFPPPAGKQVEDVQGWGVNVRADGSYALKANIGWMSTLPSWTVMCGGVDHWSIWAGRLLPTPATGTLCVASPPGYGNRQMTIGTDSTLRQFAPAVALGGETLPKKGLIDPFFSALAPDGKSQFISGITVNTEGFWRDGQVWKVDIASRATSVFFSLNDEERKDRAAIGNSDANPYSAFQGVAVDAEERVFICDRLNKRIAVVDKKGKLIRSIPVTNPDAIAVNPKSKAIYVTTRFGNYSGNGELKLLKFNDWSKDDAPAITMGLRDRIGSRAENSLLAVAEDKGEILVWVAYTTLPARVYRDTGATLELIKDFYEAGPQRALDVQHLIVDQKTGDAYIADSQAFLFRIKDWKNPKFEPCMLDAKTRLNASSIAIDARGRFIYTKCHYKDPVHRWALDGEYFTPAPVGGSNSVVPPITCAWVFTGLWERGMAAGPGGVATLGAVVQGKAGEKWDDYSGPLTYFKSDAEKTPWQGLRFSGFGGKNSGGIRFDCHGNLYAGLLDGKPKDVPRGFDKDKDFLETTGRIYKYAPTGPGSTGPGSSGDLFPTEPAAPAKVYDIHYGPMVHSPRFGIDGYGRIYYPTGLLPQVAVIDNEGNRVLAFGTYGNRDSMGGLPGDLVPTKDVPMAWPNSVDATDDYIYVSDIVNIRVLRLAKTFGLNAAVKIQ